ncbi:MAG: SPOR domain-containing protein [Cocleimonas sp.]|nr:SPOR domain-containing protein [Cocleimonas sp.]
MYVDFKEERARQSGFGSGLLWMLSGIMMGLLVGLAMYYFANRGIPSAEAASAAQGAATNTTSSFAKDRKVTSPFGDAKDSDDPETLMTASLIDKNHKEEIKERPSFSYYAVLPDLNVPIQTIHNPIEKEKPKNKTVEKVDTVEKTTVVAEKSGYFLQIASFRRRHQADRAKGRLKRKGMTTYVEKRKVKGKTWFRLMAGPVKSKTLNNWKATVVSLGHKPLVYPAK